MTILWRPSDQYIQNSNLTLFQQYVTQRFGIDVGTYNKLYLWSIDVPAAFWEAVWDYCGVITAEKGDIIYEPGVDMIQARFFPGARLNFAENLLRRRDATDVDGRLNPQGAHRGSHHRPRAKRHRQPLPLLPQHRRRPAS